MSRVAAVLLILAGLAWAQRAGAANVAVDVGGMTVDGGGGYGGYGGYGGGGMQMPMLSFSPQMVTINAGDTVTFRNYGGMHNVVADDGSFRCSSGCRGDGSGATGDPDAAEWSATVAFPRAGTFGYHCDNHGSMGMRGTVVVKAAAVSLASALSGAWYNPQQSGHGFLVEQLPGNTMLAVWFVYAPDGSKQSWVYAQGGYDPAATSVTLPALLIENGRFPPNFSTGALTSTSWGTITLSFTDCSNAQASWVSSLPGYGSGTLALTRLAGIAGQTCP